jgi:hypothetical protein
VSFTVCVALCAVLFERGVLFCVISVFLCVVSYCSTLPPGKNPFAVQLNTRNNNRTNNIGNGGAAQSFVSSAVGGAELELGGA